MKMIKQTAKGFTLIELLVVIAIIGYLSVIGLVQFKGAREKARDSRRQSDFAQIHLALNLYYNSNSQYPLEVDGDPDSSNVPPDGSIFSTVSNPLSPTYMGAIFFDPVNTAANYYIYGTSVNGQKYVLCTPLESVTGGWYNVYEDGQIERLGSCNFARL